MATHCPVTSPQANHVHAWLEFCYHNLAEPVAHVDVEADNEDEVAVNKSLFSLAPGVSMEPKGKRFLPPGKFWELYGVYHLEADASSQATFYTAYKTDWAALMPFRQVGTHARCTTCTRNSQKRAHSDVRLPSISCFTKPWIMACLQSLRATYIYVRLPPAKLGKNRSI